MYWNKRKGPTMFMPYTHRVGRSGRAIQSFRGTLLGRLTASAVAALLVFQSITPAVAAARHAAAEQTQQAAIAAATTPVERYADALQSLRELLLRKTPAGELQVGVDATASLAAKSFIDQLNTERPALAAWFEAEASGLRARNQADEIISRQRELENTWRVADAQFIQLSTTLVNANEADAPAAWQALATFVLKNVQARRGNRIDLNNMPWQVEKAQAREAIADAGELSTYLAKEEQQRFERDTRAAARHSQGAPVAPIAKSVSGPPTAEDLAETIDAPHTAAIRQLSIELGKDPVQIHNWVRNKIAFFPSYGSVQGAQDTLDKLSGNAFDTASLEIALLRASGIPARYVYGTVEIPAAQVENWVGGALDAASAQQILGQGGIPNVGLTSGGVVTAFRLEHVWVEAWVDFIPSRGAKNIEGDSWARLDPSFKQYAYATGMDLATNVPFNPSQFNDLALAGAEVNSAEGWTRNINYSAMQTRINEYRSQAVQYIATTKPAATVGDLLGSRAVTELTPSALAGTLPNKTLAIAARYSVLPDSVRHKFRYELYSDSYSANLGSALMTWQAPTVQLAGRKVTMAWVPASAADEAAILGILPPLLPDGSPPPSSALPGGMSASIRMKAEIRVDGIKVADGSAYPVGTELVGIGGFTRYSNLGSFDQTQDGLIAGQQSALGMTVQGISQAQMQRLQDHISLTRQRINAGDYAAIGIDDVTGDKLTSDAWSYFSNLESTASAAQRMQGIIDRPALSYGFVHNVAQPNKLYGIITTSVSFKGINFDVGHLRSLRWSRDNSAAGKARWLSYNADRGRHASAMENEIPEQAYIDRTQCRYVENGTVNNPTLPDCASGISAMKAIALAGQQGQKIYTLTPQNISVAIAQLSQHRSTTLDEVRAAVAAGKSVMIHERPLTVSGWTGAGYTITDPTTGSAAYLIEGKGNGGFFGLGFLAGAGLGLAILAALTPAAAMGFFVLPILILTFLAVYLLVSMIQLLIATGDAGNAGCFAQGFFVGFAIPGLFLEAIIGAIAIFFGASIPTNTWWQCLLPLVSVPTRMRSNQAANAWRKPIQSLRLVVSTLQQGTNISCSAAVSAAA